MRPEFLFIPFGAVLVAAISTAASKAFPAATWILYGGWLSALALVVLWVVLDLANFKAMFARKGAKYGASSGVVVLMAIAVLAAIATLTSRPRFDKSIDLSKSKVNTLADQSHKAIDTLEKRKVDVEVIAFFQDQEAKKQFQDLIGLYLSKGANLTVDYVDPNRDPTRAIGEKLTSGNTVIFRSKSGQTSQEARITTFNEEKVTNALIKVLKEKPKQIYFTKGHGENAVRGTEPAGLNMMIVELEGNKYEVKELSLLEEAKVPEQADLVVIAGPKYDFKVEETRLLEEHLKRGGGLLVMVEAMVPVPALNGLLEKYGIKASSDLLILRPDDPRAAFLGQNNAIVTDFDSTSPLTKDFAAQSKVAVILPSSRSVEEVPNNAAGMKVSMVAKTAPIIIRVKNVNSRADVGAGKIGNERIESGTFPVMAVATGKPTPPQTAKADDSNGPATDTPAVAEGQAGKQETRIVVVGSAQFATNQAVSGQENRDFFLNAITFLLQDEDFISIRPKDPTASTLNLTTEMSRLNLLLLTWIYPLVFLGAGVGFWMWRRAA
ncbi:MAG: ABC-type transport system involved in gliding motility [Pseudomonadota bacterium]|jgi:ABC-type uncharacterized transport system involved in gliding motility auxiliary subunit